MKLSTGHKSNRIASTLNEWPTPALIGLLATVLLAVSGVASGQAGSKESQKFLGYSEDARETLEDTKDQLAATMDYYNTLVMGEAEKPQSSYKSMTKSLDKTEKLAKKTGDRGEKMQAQAEKVFSQWQQELEGYQNEKMRELGAERLTVTKERYEQMIERMTAAGDVYNPLISSLKDQALFMGRDLSAEALSALTEVAAELNGMADELYARIAELLEDESQDEAQLAEGDQAMPDS